MLAVPGESVLKVVFVDSVSQLYGHVLHNMTPVFEGKLLVCNSVTDCSRYSSALKRENVSIQGVRKVVTY